MASIKEELKLLLTRNGVHSDVCNWLAASPQDCYEIKHFANMVDESTQVNATILQHTSQKDNVGQLARLKQAWKEANGINQTRLKRLGQGLAEDLLDEPLDSETRKSKYSIFQGFYQWTLKSRDMVCDSLFGRIVREFDTHQPSLFAVLRTRSLATSQRSTPAKKHKIAGSVQLSVGSADDDMHMLEGQGKLRTYFSCFRTLGTGWAVAGCFDVHYDGKQVKFCHWQQVCTYITHFEDKAWHAIDKYPEEIVLQYVLETEEKIRATAVEKCRNDGMPWGHALLYAWKEEAEVWTDAKDLLCATRVSQLLPRGSESSKWAPSHVDATPAKSSRQQGRCCLLARNFASAGTTLGAVPEEANVSEARCMLATSCFSQVQSAQVPPIIVPSMTP